MKILRSRALNLVLNLMVIRIIITVLPYYIVVLLASDYRTGGNYNRYAVILKTKKVKFLGSSNNPGLNSASSTMMMMIGLNPGPRARTVRPVPRHLRTRPDPGQNRLGPLKGTPSGEARQWTPAGNNKNRTP